MKLTASALKGKNEQEYFFQVEVTDFPVVGIWLGSVSRLVASWSDQRTTGMADPPLAFICMDAITCVFHLYIHPPSYPDTQMFFQLNLHSCNMSDTDNLSILKTSVSRWTQFAKWWNFISESCETNETNRIVLMVHNYVHVCKNKAKTVICFRRQHYEVSWLPEYTEWLHFSIIGFFSLPMVPEYSRMTMSGWIRLKLWNSFSGIMRSVSHMDWPKQSRI